MSGMRRIRANLRARRTEQGASAVEYGLLVAGIAAVLAIPVHAMGITLSDVIFPGVCESVAASNYSPDPEAACD